MAEKPVIYTYKRPSGIPLSNWKFETHKVPIHNIRAVSQDISLDREGFRFVVQHSNVRDFYDHDIPWISTDDIGDQAANYLLDDA
ncbi:MAG: hypothetical protein V7L29_14770 [Nostoc sp.]